jgi:hypothetical protein
MKKKYHRPEDLYKDYTRSCKICGEGVTLNLNISEQPAYWTCSRGHKNKTFWTPSDELKERYQDNK